MNPADQNLRRITKCDKDFAKKIDIKAIKSWVQTRDIHKIEFMKILALFVMKISSNIQPMYQKNVVKMNMLIY